MNQSTLDSRGVKQKMKSSLIFNISIDLFREVLVCKHILFIVLIVWIFSIWSKNLQYFLSISIYIYIRYEKESWKTAYEERCIIYCLYLIHFKFDYFFFYKRGQWEWYRLFIENMITASMIQLLAIDKSVAPNISIYWQ